MEIDVALIEEMRDLAAGGATASDILVLVGKRLGVAGTNFRLQAIAYFREAFQMSLGDAMRIGAADIFPGGGATKDEVDAHMEAFLKTYVP